MRVGRRVLIRYLLFQIPDLVLLGLALATAVHWWELSNAVAYSLFGLWVLKDILMFPVMRVAYEQGNSATDRLTGASATACETLSPTGYVKVGSELWKAEIVAGVESVPAGAAVRVVNLEGLTLRVEPLAEGVAEGVADGAVDPSEAPTS
jgi:membrane protein implicated in regulation of membrane protease activity